MSPASAERLVELNEVSYSSLHEPLASITCECDLDAGSPLQTGAAKHYRECGIEVPIGRLNTGGRSLFPLRGGARA